MSSEGYPRLIIDILTLRVPFLEGLTGQYNIEEIERNLKKRFPQLQKIYQDTFQKIPLEIIEIPPYDHIKPLIEKRSPKDAPVLASAQIGKAHYLVTGDKKGFPPKVASPIKIVSPRKFIEKILPKVVKKGSSPH